MAFGSSSRPCSIRAATLAALPVVLLLFGFVSARALAAPGDLDPTFSKDGKTETGPLGIGDYPSIAVQSDGKIVIAGGFVLARMLPDGAVDRSFGYDGVIRTDLAGAGSANAVAIQADGRILAAGEAEGGLAVARYMPDGSPDGSFSGDGKVITAIPCRATHLGIQPDGRIVAAGGGCPDYGLVVVARFKPDGSPDDSFSDDGEASIQLGGETGLALAPDGRIVLAAESYDADLNPRIAIARLRPDGTLDRSFSGDGTLTAQYSAGGDSVADVAVQPDRKIVIAGFAYAAGEFTFELVRFQPDGELDPAFAGGIVRTRIAGDALANALALDPDGKIVVAGESYPDFALARYNEDGTLDDSFSGNGKLTTSFSKPPYYYRRTLASDVALAPDGKVVAGGIVKFTNRWVLSRYKVSAGPADADADGVPDARDLCPPRFGHVEGCPHFRRSLTIRFSREYDEFRGELAGGGYKCKSDRVLLFRRRPGRDRLVGSDSTDVYIDSGDVFFRWEVSRFRPHGRYYALARRHVRPSYGICGRARSRVLDLGRR